MWRHLVPAARQPWSNAFGLARTLLAISFALTLTLNSISDLFPYGQTGEITIGEAAYFNWLNLFRWCGPDHLQAARLIALGVCVAVISGFYPRVTAVLYWWVTYSFFTAASVLDGGDQINAIIALLFLPIALTDPRRNHWSLLTEQSGPRRRLIANGGVLALKLQICMLYLHAFFGKLFVAEWIDGSVLYYWFTDSTFGLAPGLRDFVMPILTNGIAVSLMTWSVLALEFFLAASIIGSRGAKRVLFPIAIFFHTAIAVIHGIPSFVMIMYGALVIYLIPLDRQIQFQKKHHIFSVK